MKFTFKNKLLSLADSSEVYDESGNVVYHVQGKLATFRDTKTVVKDGVVIFTICNKLVSLLSRRATVYDGVGTEIFRVRRNFGFTNKFVIEGYKKDITLKGGFTGWNYDILIDNNYEGHIHKEFTWTHNDTYTVDVKNDNNADLFLALTVALDIIQDKRNNS